jgi:hypothetical protein
MKRKEHDTNVEAGARRARRDEDHNTNGDMCCSMKGETTSRPAGGVLGATARDVPEAPPELGSALLSIPARDVIASIPDRPALRLDSRSPPRAVAPRTPPAGLYIIQ